MPSTLNPGERRSLVIFGCSKTKGEATPLGDGRIWEREDSEVRMEIDAVRNAEDVALRLCCVMLCYGFCCSTRAFYESLNLVTYLAYDIRPILSR